ncbi:TrbI F-type domain-containing protein [Asticcacaulis sp. BYS171W]|uniref:TrbI F-type domain-containing protein n=1 Tax=Asticcacaulis aquaticus TaxID=2984212 RepID=A0ABT5HWV7_9CAUL|nr:TrbI F-type domain-containing protein [Asticcacaulis aquaticus]MDC7684413.1 TrbI F-type domain-containing protein [Asticcacaulis aquaticus]
MQASPEAEAETPSTVPTLAPKRKVALPRLSGQHVLIGLLAINMVVTGALWFRVMTDTRPVIATIGLTSLARNYAQSLASDPTISPEALQIRTQLFMAEGQKEINRLTADGGMVLLARECVLKGEDVDLTPQFAASLNTQLAATKSRAVGTVADVPAQ